MGSNGFMFVFALGLVFPSSCYLLSLYLWKLGTQNEPMKFKRGREEEGEDGGGGERGI